MRSRYATLTCLVFAAAAVVQAQAVHSRKPLKGDVEAGASIYMRNCIMCHATTQGVKIVGPSLYGEMKGAHAATAARVREQTLNGKGQMPPFKDKLSEQDMADLLAYIKKL